MTNDELEAVRARASAIANGPVHERRALMAEQTEFATALLEEVARLRALAVFDDGTPEGLPYKTLWDEALKMGAEDVREVMARATRAEAEVERLQHDIDRARGAQGELLAHAERLASALEALTVAADGIKHWHDAMSDSSGMVVSAEHVRALWGERDQARQALSAYRGEMK